ncbi:MAG: Trk system potassium transporter TrkA [Gammaproteobacteria bacterium]|nr:Trk system potassium transporter TrkA [Gammaproteobacteria bacterium]NNC98264.1 Trk system potassium transporter TrkA [Gammaproteobacteria bacterium]NNM14911.1 Trk system potassium transporter TrkA [Gammaproteobacteria bacterium]
MKILILGAGQVGSTAAYNLAQEEQNEITVVDTDAEVLKELSDRLDIRTVEGFASHPRVLEQAGCNDADIMIALTNSDETNMVACQVAYTLFHTKTKIARVRESAYTHPSVSRIFSQDALPVDVIISPEQLVTEHIERLIHFPGALQVLEFADGKVRLVGVTAHEGGLLVGQELRALAEHMPNTDARVAAIYRDGLSVMPDGDTVIQEGDNVFFIAERNDIRMVMSEMRKLETPVRRVLIAGGGNIGYQLAKVLERTNKVKLIERDRDRARRISEKLRKTIVLTGDAADQNLLLEENIENTDVFVSVTNSEEANILSAMVAKRLGVKKAIALINRPSYGEVVESGGVIDVAVSPQQITSGALLSHVRRGDVVKVHTLRRGAAEALEAIAHGDKETSQVVGRALEDIDLPKGSTIAAIVRDEEVIIAHHDVVVERDDHVILFLTDRTKIPAVEDLFQVSVNFSNS